MDDLFLLSEAQMRRIKPHFPQSHGVRRQSFSDRRWLKLRESLWLVRFVMLGGLPPVQQAAISNCLSFDPFS
jgi:hypothetical protein